MSRGEGRVAIAVRRGASRQEEEGNGRRAGERGEGSITAGREKRGMFLSEGRGVSGWKVGYGKYSLETFKCL